MSTSTLSTPETHQASPTPVRRAKPVRVRTHAPLTPWLLMAPALVRGRPIPADAPVTSATFPDNI